MSLLQDSECRRSDVFKYHGIGGTFEPRPIASSILCLLVDRKKNNACGLSCPDRLDPANPRELDPRQTSAGPDLYAGFGLRQRSSPAEGAQRINDIYFAASVRSIKTASQSLSVIGGKVVIRASARVPFWE